MSCVGTEFELRIFQKGFNFSQDGPGNRLVYHLQGCNFSCPWCSNPEGMSRSCASTKVVTVQELVDEALRCRPMFFSSGGVTFTGGECTLQFAALLEALRRLKEAGIHTCIETNASHKSFGELLPFVDFLIADLKHTDCDLHTRFTGVSNSTVLSNLADVLDSGRQVLIRIPLINGVNTDPEGFVEFFKAHPSENARVELLSYHEFGKDKWTTPYTVTNGFVSEETLARFENELNKNSIKTVRT